MTYALVMTLLVACGEQNPKPTIQNEASKLDSSAEVGRGDSKSQSVLVEKESAAKSEGFALEATTSTARTGGQVYTQVCVTCHQANGEGMTGVYPPLAGSDWMAKSNDTLIKIVLHGLMGQIEVKGIKYNNVMSPWGSALDDEEIANVLTYVRSSWGNTGGLVTAEEVKAIRTANKGHSPWQLSEL